ncbi:VOC family protein [Pseudonocardia sp. C8]|uniref:VOC family protein n=1 Tax=Pseudonocardia sp. C8 TaxID=2762759 RepID=UPI001642551C|nr:VOC family protein [Pseudonocardia sp. C8]MBC3193104.1 VOC family protein [Pseudonocardia sp. C8]
MESVLGVGGIFFRARDPEALTRWYEQNLGVTPPPTTYDEPSWHQQAGPTVFAAMPDDSPHFPDARQQWSINFRVANLDAMIDQLRRNGVDVTPHDETYPNGRFAELTDPEGTPIQLWEPAGADVGEFPRGATS